MVLLNTIFVRFLMETMQVVIPYGQRSQRRYCFHFPFQLFGVLDSIALSEAFLVS